MNRKDAKMANEAWKTKTVQERKIILTSALVITSLELLNYYTSMDIEEIYYNDDKDFACDIVQAYLDGEWH